MDSCPALIFDIHETDQEASYGVEACPIAAYTCLPDGNGRITSSCRDYAARGWLAQQASSLWLSDAQQTSLMLRSP
jgi:hypothetical protein